MNRAKCDSSLALQPIEALGSTRNFLKALLSADEQKISWVPSQRTLYVSSNFVSNLVER